MNVPAASIDTGAKRGILEDGKRPLSLAGLAVNSNSELRPLKRTITSPILKSGGRQLNGLRLQRYCFGATQNEHRFGTYGLNSDFGASGLAWG